MPDDPRITDLAEFVPGGKLTPGFGDTYLFLVGRDDVHGIMLRLIGQENLAIKLNQFGYDDEELNAALMGKLGNPNVRVQATLDQSQAGGVHERKILAEDAKLGPAFYNSFVIGQSATHQISHTKAGVLVGQGLAWEGSTNWSASGEGTGIKLDPAERPEPGFKAQNNTVVITANAVFVSVLGARLDAEHSVALQQQAARALKESTVHAATR